jgi:ribonuclease HII
MSSGTPTVNVASADGRLRIGVDENGLGARLGPLVVTAVAAEVTEAGERLFKRRLRGQLSQDLDDSKRLVTHNDVGLGEAWARALLPPAVESPADLFAALSLYAPGRLTELCPAELKAQCWNEPGPTPAEAFEADPAVLSRLRRHRSRLEKLGLRVLAVRSAVLCTKRLNLAQQAGNNRFHSDLHAMEELVLALRELLGRDVFAVCGKVGAMREYSRFFGPLAGRLHAIVEERPQRSAYYFPGLGEVCFEENADSRDPLVMLASLVGKYVRELLMTRIQRFHAPEAVRVSGYHDSKTGSWIEELRATGRSLPVFGDCFERARAGA